MRRKALVTHCVRLYFSPIRYTHQAVGMQLKRTIRVDPRYCGNLARVILHELIHLHHQRWSETRVRREESRRWRRLTWQDKARLFQMLGKARIETLEERRDHA